MRTYTVEIANGVRPEEPYEVDLPDLSAARKEAVRLLGAMLTHEHEDFWATRDLQVLVKDESGLLLFELRVIAVDAPAVHRHPNTQLS